MTSLALLLSLLSLARASQLPVYTMPEDQLYAPGFCLREYCRDIQEIEGVTDSLAAMSQQVEAQRANLTRVRAALEDATTLVTSTPQPRDFEDVRSELDELEQRLNDVQNKLNALPKTSLSPDAQTGLEELSGQVVDSLEDLKRLQGEAEELLGLQAAVEQQVSALVSRKESLDTKFNDLVSNIRSVSIPHFFALFSPRADVMVPARACSLIEVTLDVLYVTVPYFGGTTHVILLTNGSPIYNGVEDCADPLNPAAVSDFAYGAPSRTFYVQDNSEDVHISYIACESFKIDIQAYLTVKCYKSLTI